MMEPGITVEGVWKKFRRGERHDSLRDLVPSLVRGLGQRRDPAELKERDFWALRDVTFEVKPGQAIGIIGHNGAGKSTLLKLITRIMRPTLGRCEVRGRVGALIELAAGFHPDLTGRENVFLQGAIMGMPGPSIKKRFEEIVEFAGVRDFIDTPVKRYSSGMNARLGFAIAAHLDPDVLIIDEVLSVGDLAFQERAFGRMQQVVQSGIPVAVVSHQLDRVAALTTQAVLLRRGQVVKIGTPNECINEYVTGQLEARDSDFSLVPGLTLGGIELEAGSKVRSGDRKKIILRGNYHPITPEKPPLGVAVRIRRMDTGQVVSNIWSHRLGATIQAGQSFDLAFDLQFNLPPGVCAVETDIFDASSDHQLAHGPYSHVEVVPGTLFRGSVQLNPEVILTPRP